MDNQDWNENSSTDLTFDFKIEDLVKSNNIAEMLSGDDLEKIGIRVVEEYNLDLDSRREWEKKTADAMKLALQVTEQKTFPWPGAANVKFPLVTIAALQFHSRAYPMLIPGTDVVRCKVTGNDPEGTRTERAKRISAHMSYQVLEEDENWEDQMDKVLISLPIVGCAFKKSYFDNVLGHNVSEHVQARDLVIPYYAPSLEKASRLTHVLQVSGNTIYEKIASGIYCDTDLGSPNYAPRRVDELSEAKDESQKLVRPLQDRDAPYTLLEQHRYFDFDGDGYKEPYIVVVHEETKKVLRIVARFFKEDILYNKKKKIVSIKPIHFFTKFSMVPSPDGGIYDLGFGSFLGPLNESINTVINQLLDSGTMSITAGGFLARGAKIRSGQNTFAPFEWKRVDATGDDLRKSVMPLPVREPSNVLLSLLTLLINYGERIAGATDIMVGENVGQNTPAETSRHMVEQGNKIFSGIFKRVYRSLKEEFRKLYRLNQLYLDEQFSFEELSNGKSAVVLRQDYYGPDTDVRPSADPNVASDAQRMMQARALVEASRMAPGYNHYEVHKRYLESLKVQNIEQVFPDPKGPNAIPAVPHPRLQVEQLKAQEKQLASKVKLQIKSMELLEKADVTRATVLKLEAEAVKLMAEAEGVRDGHAIALLNAQIAAAKSEREGTLKAVELIRDIMESTKEEATVPDIPQPTQDMETSPKGM